MENDEIDNLPPFFKNWKQMYLALLIFLCVLIGLFYWLTVAFV